jgi:hypothetical protein
MGMQYDVQSTRLTVYVDVTNITGVTIVYG